LGGNVACRGVVADRELIQLRCRAIDFHIGAAIEGNAANTSGTLPEHLSQMANVVKHSVGNAGLAKVRLHRWKLTLIPALCDACRHVEDCTRDGEEILALVRSFRNVVRKIARLCGNTSVILTGRVPCEWSGAMVRASSVVMV